MKLFLLGIGGALKSLKASLIGLGALGVLGIALLDAAMVPLPGGTDAAVMALSHLNHAMMPLYVIAAIVGATLGCLFPYWIGRKTGEAALRKFSDEKRARINRMLERYDFWAMLVGAILPPGFPFKPLLLAAGVFRMNVLKFLSGIAIGRTIRFSFLGWMVVRYGEHATEILKQHYPKIGLGMVAAIIVILLVNSLRQREDKEEKVADAA